jgi:hypothetical protein
MDELKGLNRELKAISNWQKYEFWNLHPSTMVCCLLK